MKNFIKTHKPSLIICFWILTSICFLFGGAIIGLEYYQEEFVDFRATIVSIVKGDNANDTTNDDTSDAIDIINLTVNGFNVSIADGTDTHTWFDVEQMSTLISNTITLDAVLDGYDVWIDGSQVEVGDELEIELELLGQAIGIEIALVDQETSATTYYNIRTLNSAYNAYTSGEGEGDGYYYFTQNGFIYKMDMSGNIVYYKDCNGTDARDFKQVTIDGTVYYTYLEEGMYYTDEKLNTGYVQSRAVVMDENYVVIDEIDFISSEEGMPEEHSLESHEFIMLDVGHYFITAYVGMDVDNIPTDVDEDGDGEAYVVAAVIQEIKDDELIFQWVSTDYPELYAYSADLMDYSADEEQDYMHFNSIDFDEDGNLICSFRRIDGVIKIDRETGDIIWILGGDGDEFGLTDDQKFSYQHLAYYSSENTITLFDNGLDILQTRVVEITIDEDTKTVLDYNSYEIEGYYSAAMGSAIRLDDDEAIFLIGWGTRSADNIMFTEINFDTGEVLFELMDLDDESPQNTYRVFKFDS